MMPEISLNILDIAENSVKAGASIIEISVCADTEKNLLTVEIKDNGCGMDEEKIKRVTDPFYTTRTTRKVGLGVPFFKEAAEAAGGSFNISSAPGKGTDVTALFELDNIDRMPLGDICSTMHTLITMHCDIDFIFTYCIDKKSFVLDTREFREILEGIPFDSYDVSNYIKGFLKENISSVNENIIL